MPTIFKIRVWGDFDTVSPIVEYGVLCKYCGVLYRQFRQKIHAERNEKIIRTNAPCEPPSFT